MRGTGRIRAFCVKEIQVMYVTQRMIFDKLIINQVIIMRSKMPVGLHADTRCKLDGWCAIGIVDRNSGVFMSFGDVYVGKDVRLNS